MLVMAMVLQNFDVKLDDPNYTMKIKQNLTIKPDDLYIRVALRRNVDATSLDNLLHASGPPKGTKDMVIQSKANDNTTPHSTTSSARSMTVLFGSNTGTCQAFAQRLASEAAGHGFKADVKALDSATESLPRGGPVIIITSSYEGQPPDNAARFIEWLQSCGENSLRGVEYTVFGCGHSK